MNEALLARFQQAYQDLDLFPLLEPEEIQRFRVDYGQDTLVRLKREIEASPKNGKAIFTGHRGCGKSTLLKRLALEMGQREHFVVFFSISDLIEMSAVSHTNILYAIALMLLSKATQAKIAIAKDIQTALLGWNTTVRKQYEQTQTKSQMGLSLDKVLQIISLSLQQENSFREELERRFEKRMSELVGMANRIAATIQIKTGKPVLVIIDDIDKLDLPLTDVLYRQNIKALFSPDFRILFTIPISAIRETSLNGSLMSEGIGRVRRLPVAKFFSKEDRHNPIIEPEPMAFNTLLDVLRRRIPEDLIEPETAKKIVRKSGGVMRELVRIARECCNECMVEIEVGPEDQAVQINEKILTTALRSLRNDFALSLGDKLITLLVDVYEKAEPEDAASPEFLDLLHGLYVLEYLNDDLWFDVHPIVVDLLKQRQRIG